MLRKTLALAGLAIGGLWAPAGFAQDIVIPNIIELSGGGATVGAMWKNGSSMAIDEINAKGGILGRKIELKQYDTQTNPGTARSQMQKAIDEEPYVILGPIFSGIVKVSMMLAQQAEIPQIIGGEASDLTQQGNAYLFRTSFGQQVVDAEDRELHARHREGEVRRDRLGQQRLRQGRARQLHQGDEFARHQDRGRHLDRIRPDRLRRRRREGSRRANADAIFVYTERRRERALPARGAASRASKCR